MTNPYDYLLTLRKIALRIHDSRILILAVTALANPPKGQPN